MLMYVLETKSHYIVFRKHQFPLIWPDAKKNVEANKNSISNQSEVKIVISK